MRTPELVGALLPPPVEPSLPVSRLLLTVETRRGTLQHDPSALLYTCLEDSRIVDVGADRDADRDAAMVKDQHALSGGEPFRLFVHDCVLAVDADKLSLSRDDLGDKRLTSVLRSTIPATAVTDRRSVIETNSRTGSLSRSSTASGQRAGSR